MAEPSAGGELPARLLRRNAGQDPRRGHGPQQGGLHRPGRPGRRHEGYSRPVDREHRRRQVLAASHERTQEPGRRRHSHRRCRWPEGIPRSDQRRLSGDDHPDLRRASDPAFAGVRLVERSQACRAGAAHDLPGQGRRRRQGGARRFRCRPLGAKISRHRAGLAAQLGQTHSVLRLPGGGAPDHLHDERH